jgi:hypothetical protein
VAFEPTDPSDVSDLSSPNKIAHQRVGGDQPSILIDGEQAPSLGRIDQRQSLIGELGKRLFDDYVYTALDQGHGRYDVQMAGRCIDGKPDRLGKFGGVRKLLIVRKAKLADYLASSIPRRINDPGCGP